MTFSNLGLNPGLVRRLGTLGYHDPWPIQAQAIQPAMSGRDVIGLAQTGKGKTLAFAIPMVDRLVAGGRQADRGRVEGLVICPTRELAAQVARDIGSLLKGTRRRTAVVFGKVGMRPQIERLEAGVDILVGTPGRLRDLLAAGALTLGRVSMVTIDEADRMLDAGFLPQVRDLLAAMPSERQTMLFTATMPSEVEELAQQFLRDPVRVEADPHTTPVDHVSQHIMPVHDRNKIPLLLHLLANDLPRGVLVFCRTKRRVGWVATALARNGIAVGVLHGDRSQAQRERALESFQTKSTGVIVASEVAARGLHIPVVKTVVNYDLPFAPEEYVHRIGRAGHGGDRGVSVTFVTPTEMNRWEKHAARLDLDLPMSVPDDFEAPFQAPSRRREQDLELEARAGRIRETKGRGAMRGRSRRASRSIGDQKPGGGVKRPKSDS